MPKNYTTCPIMCPEICGPNTTMCDRGYDENGCWLGNECKTYLDYCTLDNCGPDHMECPKLDLGVGCVHLCSLPKIDGCEHTVEKICPKSCGMGQSHCITEDENGCPYFTCAEGPNCSMQNQTLNLAYGSNHLWR